MPIILIIIVLVILGAGLIFAKNLNNKGPAATPTPAPEQNVLEKIPEDSLDVIFTPRFDNRAFTLAFKNLKEKDYTSFEYEVSYDAESSEEPGQIITQGSASREPIVVTGDDFFREILLGTCSKNICKYDKGVTSVKVTLRLTTRSGKTHLWEKEFSLE